MNIIEDSRLGIVEQQYSSIGDVTVIVLASSAIEREFEIRSCPTKDYKIDICCFSAKHTSLTRKSRLVCSESG
jgi:ribosomal protein L31